MNILQGSPRNMQQNYQDAMSIVRKFGKPDLFVTFTCNPQWEEVKANLLPGKYFGQNLNSEKLLNEYWNFLIWGQTYVDRPDLVARVFNLKLKRLLFDISHNHIFGIPIALVYVIEFQKRGLPHAHILIILRHEDKIRTAEDIDRLISAEIPDKNLNPQLFEIVSKSMVHGPCGIQNPKASCMEEGKCVKEFPKPFRAETLANGDGYPHYRRRDDGKAIFVNGHRLDNRFIVPYNPLLTKKYQAHINVEICATVKSVKYLYKYIYKGKSKNFLKSIWLRVHKTLKIVFFLSKGHDCANMELMLNNQQGRLNLDEIKSFLNARYVSAPEACWRLFEFRMNFMSHTIKRLAVHLPFQQRVVFQAGCENEALQRAASTDTTLTAWFKLNSTNVKARNFFYHEIPLHFKFESNEWIERSRPTYDVITRMYNVSPTADNERFCLRLLLLHVKGATSFEDLKNVDRVPYPSFKEAAKARGLLESDQHLTKTLDEAVSYRMPSQLRELFATICLW